MLLSERHANTTPLLTSIEQDQRLQASLLSGRVDESKLQQAIQYVVDQYGCSETEAEEGLGHLLRQQVQLSEGRKARKAQAQPGKQIIIPPTIDDPIGKKVPVEKVSAPKTEPLTINAQPSNTQDQKLQDVTKPLVQNENRQQGIIDAIKAVKVAVADLGQKMYNLEMSEENTGVVMEKIIESVSHAMADQTAKTVENMASPLLSRG